MIKCPNCGFQLRKESKQYEDMWGFPQKKREKQYKDMWIIDEVHPDSFDLCFKCHNCGHGMFIRLSINDFIAHDF